MVSPVEGLIENASVTLPANPPRLARLIVEELLLPDWNATLAGFDEME